VTNATDLHREDGLDSLSVKGLAGEPGVELDLLSIETQH